jgi:hypothetical protein
MKSGVGGPFGHSEPGALNPRRESLSPTPLAVRDPYWYYIKCIERDENAQSDLVSRPDFYLSCHNRAVHLGTLAGAMGTIEAKRTAINCADR